MSCSIIIDAKEYNTNHFRLEQAGELENQNEIRSSTGVESRLAGGSIMSNEKNLDLEIYAKRCFQHKMERLSRMKEHMIPQAQCPPEDDQHSDDDMNEKEDEYANETNQRKLFHKHLESL